MSDPFQLSGLVRPADDGGLVDSADHPMAVVPSQFVIWVQHALEIAAPSAGGGGVLYRVGEIFGRRVCDQIGGTVGSGGAASMHPDEFNKVLKKATRAMGWGEINLVPEDDWLFADLFGGAIQRALDARVPKPSNAFYAGFVAGVLGQVGGKRLTVVEVPPSQQPTGAIRFRVHPHEDMDAVQFWSQHGARIADMKAASPGFDPTGGF